MDESAEIKQAGNVEIISESTRPAAVYIRQQIRTVAAAAVAGVSAVTRHRPFINTSLEQDKHATYIERPSDSTLRRRTSGEQERERERRQESPALPALVIVLPKQYRHVYSVHIRALYSLEEKGPDPRAGSEPHSLEFKLFARRTNLYIRTCVLLPPLQPTAMRKMLRELMEGTACGGGETRNCRR